MQRYVSVKLPFCCVTYLCFFCCGFSKMPLLNCTHEKFFNFRNTPGLVACHLNATNSFGIVVGCSQNHLDWNPPGTPFSGPRPNLLVIPTMTISVYILRTHTVTLGSTSWLNFLYWDSFATVDVGFMAKSTGQAARNYRCTNWDKSRILHH